MEYRYCTQDVPHFSDVITSSTGPAPEANPVDIEVRTPFFQHDRGRVLTRKITQENTFDTCSIIIP